MKIVIFTYDRYETISTPLAMSETPFDYLVVCHSEEARLKFIEAGNVRKERIVISDVPKGLANNRNWFLENHLKDGEWCLMLCDDFLKNTCLDDYRDRPKGFLPFGTENTTYWSRKFRTEISMFDFVSRCEETALECERRGILLGGFAGADNPIFRRIKWKTNVLCDGRALLLKKSKLRFDVNAQMVDDVAFSALNIERAGGTLVNQWVLPYFSRYTKGSYGSIPERIAQRKSECNYLADRFKGLVKIADKPGWPFGTHVRIKPMDPMKLSEWKNDQKNRFLYKIKKGRIIP